MENFVSEGVENYIQCEVCGESLRFISWNHLAKHSLTRETYQELYPTSALCSEGYKKERGLQNKKVWENPVLREKMAEATKRRFQIPGERDKNSEKIKEVLNNPVIKEKHRQGVIKSWTDDRRKKTSETITSQWDENETRKRETSERLKLRWQSYREQLVNRNKEITSSPEVQEKMKIGRKELTENLKNLVEEYSSKGYKAVALHHGFPVPDLIIVKDNRVIAVEVGKSRKNKYDGIKFYDDILWIRKPKKYGV